MNKDKVKFITIRGKRIPIKDKKTWWNRKPEEGTLARKIQDFGSVRGPAWKKIRERSKKAGLTGLKAPSWWRKKKK